MLAFLLPFLRANWKWIAVCIAVLAILAYVKVLHMERDHYKAKYENEHLAFQTYRSNAESMQAALKSSSAALTLQLKTQAIEQNKAAEVYRKSINERIKADEASKRIMLPPASVVLINDTTVDPTTSGSSDPNIRNADGSGSAYTLNDLEENIANNNANHWSCIRQVVAWQSMWKQFVKNVKDAEAWGGT